MPLLERKIIAVAMLLSLLWGAGLFAVYMLQDSSSSMNSAQRTNLAVPDMVRADAPASQVPVTLAVAGALSFPQAAVVAPAAEDVVARRKQLLSVQSRNGAYRGVRYGWESRYTNQTGTILPPTTAPTGAPTLVSVHVLKASFRQALVAVATAAKIKVSIAPPGWLDQPSDQPPIDLNADAKPLLEVMNELCCLGATQMYDTGRGMWGGAISAADPAVPVIYLEHQGASMSLGPWVISGPFSFEAQQIFHSVSVDGGTVSQTPLQVTLKIAHEPSMVVFGESQQPTVSQAIDEKGHSLMAGNSSVPPPAQGMSFAQILASAVGLRTHGASQDFSSERWNSQQDDLTIQLNCPVDCGRTISKLAGSERFLIQEKATRVEVGVASPPVSVDKAVDGVAVTIDQWQVMSPQQISFQLVIHHTNQDAQTWSRLQAGIQRINPVLLDASGKALPSVRSWNSGPADDTVASTTFMCQQNGWGERETALVPAKLVVYVPTSFVVVDVPFELDNLPLP